LDNTVSITYLLSFWKYKQFLEVYKIILGLFEYIILKSSALFQTSILSLNLADCFLEKRLANSVSFDIIDTF